jgi:pimeloyl-ACP methyl ester carboxylesterase
MFEWPQRLLQTASLHIAYREAGRGPVLMLLHGISSGAGSWKAAASRLCDRFRVIAWDAPGYGDSEAFSCDQPDASLYAAALQEMVAALELESVHLVGHSLGAMIASAYAAAHPQHVRSLLLANPAQGYGSTEPAERAQVAQSRVQLLRDLGVDAYIEQRAPRLLRPQPHPAALETVRASMRRLHLEGFTQANWMLANDDLWRYLPRWQGPLSVLCGDLDTITPPAHVTQVAERMHVVCQRLANAGHASYLDEPQAFAECVVHHVDAAEQRVAVQKEST